MGLEIKLSQNNGLKAFVLMVILRSVWIVDESIYI